MVGDHQTAFNTAVAHDRSRDVYKPIRSKYPGHVITLNQSEASIGHDSSHNMLSVTLAMDGMVVMCYNACYM